MKHANVKDGETGRGHRGPTVRRLAALFVSLSLPFVAMAISTTAAEAASPAWKPLAVTAPTYIPPKQSEVQRLTVEAGVELSASL